MICITRAIELASPSAKTSTKGTGSTRSVAVPIRAACAIKPEAINSCPLCRVFPRPAIKSELNSEPAVTNNDAQQSLDHKIERDRVQHRLVIHQLRIERLLGRFHKGKHGPIEQCGDPNMPGPDLACGNQGGDHAAYRRQHSVDSAPAVLTQPSDKAEPVRLYTSHPCATLRI